ncbi:hypothetical protein GALMADRAFT_462501 [Galerina marginata CBS 339.88]|uniref:Uncharacterized protein n=1 Tax=Galerina marginata (strain CBS 339.88) TaxID=685588 RepID=A0A067SYW3_GALM3|nr:hypothetical protein GALMADRAFT_462501 [Galerina marginata CBS 339.88]
MIIYANPAFYVFLASFTAFILLMLTTFSVPLVSTFYFMHSSQANGVTFGMWGWCLDEGGLCSPLRLGYTWDPEVPIPLTKALIFYPITVVFVFFTMASMVPVVCARTARSDKIFDIFAWISFAFSAFSFLFMIGIWGAAKSKFEKLGFTASYGNLPWMSLVATLLLLVVALSPYFLGPPPKQSSRRNTRSRRDVEAARSGPSRRKLHPIQPAPGEK